MVSSNRPPSSTPSKTGTIPWDDGVLCNNIGTVVGCVRLCQAASVNGCVADVESDTVPNANAVDALRRGS